MLLIILNCWFEIDTMLKIFFSGKFKSKNQGIYYLYLEAVSVRNSKSQSAPEDMQVTRAEIRDTTLFDLYSFSSRDLEFIVKFAEEHDTDIFRQIVQSICPSIYGHELVKGEVSLKNIYHSDTRNLHLFSVNAIRYLGAKLHIFLLIFKIQHAPLMKYKRGSKYLLSFVKCSWLIFY